jgi:hypothetical protein
MERCNRNANRTRKNLPKAESASPTRLWPPRRGDSDDGSLSLSLSSRVSGAAATFDVGGPTRRRRCCRFVFGGATSTEEVMCRHFRQYFKRRRDFVSRISKQPTWGRKRTRESERERGMKRDGENGAENFERARLDRQFPPPSPPKSFA